MSSTKNVISNLIKVNSGRIPVKWSFYASQFTYFKLVVVAGLLEFLWALGGFEPAFR